MKDECMKVTKPTKILFKKLNTFSLVKCHDNCTGLIDRQNNVMILGCLKSVKGGYQVDYLKNSRNNNKGLYQ